MAQWLERQPAKLNIGGFEWQLDLLSLSVQAIFHKKSSAPKQITLGSPRWTLIQAPLRFLSTCYVKVQKCASGGVA